MTTEDKEREVDAWEYDVTPKHVRFQLVLPDGEKYLTLDQETWDSLNQQFGQEIHRAKPITENDLPNFIQRIQRMRNGPWMSSSTDDPRPAAMLINIAKRADGLGYILRVYEKAHDREWNITTYGEFDALEASVYGRSSR